MRSNIEKYRPDLLKIITSPIHSALHRTGPKTRKFEKTENDQVHTENRFEWTLNERAALITFVSGNTQTVLLCVEYCKLNVITKPASYLVACMDKCVSMLEQAIFFSTLDTNGKYRQGKIEDNDRYRSASSLLHRFQRFSECFLHSTTRLKPLDAAWTSYPPPLSGETACFFFKKVLTVSKQPKRHIGHFCRVILKLHSRGWLSILESARLSPKSSAMSTTSYVLVDWNSHFTQST